MMSTHLSQRARPARSRPTAALPLAILAILHLAACAGDEAPAWTEATDHRWRPLRVEGSGPGFTALAADRTGIDFENRLSEELLVRNEILANGSGVALGDADGDGRVDVYLCRLEGPNVLYRNLGDWRFEDVTEVAGVGLSDRFSRGAVFADLDGDGDLDLLVSVHDGENALFLNAIEGKRSGDGPQWSRPPKGRASL